MVYKKSSEEKKVSLALDQYGRVVINDEKLLDLVSGAQGALQMAEMMPDGGGCGCNGSCGH